MSDILSNIQKNHPAGKFHQTLLICDGNQQMYDLIGDNLYYTFYRVVPDTERDKLKNAVEQSIRQVGVQTEEMIHVVTADGRESLYMIYLTGRPDGYVEMEAVPVSDYLKRTMQLESELQLERNYRTLSGDIFLEYTVADDLFHLYWINQEQTITLAKMPLKEWEKSVLDQKRIREADCKVFRTFCECLREQKTEQNMRFHGSILSRGRREDAILIRLMKQRYQEQEMVIGICNIVNEYTGDFVDNYTENASIDQLTGLLSKKSITDYAENVLQRSGEKMVAIAIMDIDDFKSVNDNFGHMFGDEVIAATAAVIRAAVRENGVAGRIGGDEFMIIFENYESELNLRNYLRAIRTNMQELFQDKMKNKRLSCSIGVSRSDVISEEYPILFKVADQALYLAKMKGKNRYVIYKPEMHGPVSVTEDADDCLKLHELNYSDENFDRVHRKIGETILKGTEEIKALLEATRITLNTSRLCIYLKQGKEFVLYEAAVSEDEKAVSKLDVSLQNEAFLKMFQNDRVVINNVNLIEYSIPECYQVFQSYGIRGIMGKLLRDEDGEVFGIASMEECRAIRHIPKVEIRLFDNVCEVVRTVMLRDSQMWEKE